MSEALSLGVGDIDLRAGVITVLHGKFGKERLVPVAETTRLRLRDYASERDRLLGRRPPTFFVSDKGDPLTDCAARYNFAHVCQAIGLREPQRFNRHGRGPRIHDLRHSFAVHTLIGWYRTGQDPDREMIKLTPISGTAAGPHLLVHRGCPRAPRACQPTRRDLPRRGGSAMTSMTLAVLLQHFFTDRLCTQMQASPHTIAGYRDTFRLLLRFASAELGRPPTRLAVEDLDVELIGNFLTHIETTRSNSARSRNTRLAAIRSFFRFVALSEPALILHCQKILAMPSKRYDRRAVAFLDRAEMEALLAAPDHSTGPGDAITRCSFSLSRPASGHRRSSASSAATWSPAPAPTSAATARDARSGAHPCGARRSRCWRPGSRSGRRAAGDPLFPTIRGGKLSRDALERIVRRHILTAAKRCPSLVGKRVSPHVLRHSTAMDLLHHGVDQAVIALWLGHETVETTQIYIHADLRLKERALARVTAPDVKPGRYRPDDQLLAFLEAL